MLTYPTKTDQELLELLRRDDHAAFREIYERQWKNLYASAFYSLRSTEDCMDVCQTVFLWLWENRSTIEINSSLQGYLYTAVRYKIANLIRKGKVHDRFIDQVFAGQITTDETLGLEVKELQHFIGQLIAQLPEKCRQVFLLSREENLSHKQIAQKLGISEKTVDDHITRALKKLRGPLGRLAMLFLSL